MTRTYQYYSVWSDNQHKFKRPIRTFKEQKISFPDITFFANNINHAIRIIEQVNEMAKDIDREKLTIRI